jgi:hypothetical protein
MKGRVLLITTIFAFLSNILLAQNATTAGKTFSKSFNTEGKGRLDLDLPGTVDLKVWDNPNIRIEISVALPNGSSAMLNELATVGRYNLTAVPENDILLIQSPNLQKQVKVKGEVLKENLTYVVFVPKTMLVQMRNAAELAQKK